MKTTLFSVKCKFCTKTFSRNWPLVKLNSSEFLKRICKNLFQNEAIKNLTFVCREKSQKKSFENPEYNEDRTSYISVIESQVCKVCMTLSVTCCETALFCSTAKPLSHTVMKPLHLDLVRFCLTKNNIYKYFNVVNHI